MTLVTKHDFWANSRMPFWPQRLKRPLFALQRSTQSRLRGASHYGRRSRGRHFSPIKLQENQSLVSRPFTLWSKSKGRRNLIWLFFEERDGLSKEVWVIWEWKPKLWLRGHRFFSLKNQLLTRSWLLDWEGYFKQGIKWDASFGFGLWAWPLEASNYAQLKAPLPIFCWLYIFSPFLWTLNKVWPLNPTASRLGRP
jgi:hypothetical protein